MPASDPREVTINVAAPNILLIVSDDHGYGDRSALGHDPAVRTPALDRIAADGISCTDAYVVAPICSPSRAGLISGRYPQRWGSTFFANSRFAPDGETLAERLSAVGYRTGYFGKVHYGPEARGDRACPPHHGFDVTWYGLAGRQQGRLNYLRHSESAVAEYGDEASWRMAVQPMLEGDDEVELEGFLTEEIGRRSSQFLADDDGSPFFAMVAFNAVHNFCWQLPPEELEARGLPVRADWHDADDLSYADWYDGVISPNLTHGREYYLAQLELMDREIGALLDQLDAAGKREDTIVVYLTDNGGSTCNYGDNAPLSGTKYTLWEGGIRVPLLMGWPGGQWCGGREVTEPVTALDLYPTLLAAAGDKDAPPSDGVDVSGALAGGAGPVREALFWDCEFQWAVRAGDLKLRWVDPESPEAEGIRHVEHAEPGAGWSLHDVRADPGEHHDLAEQQPDDVARLRALHEAWREEIGYFVAGRTEAAALGGDHGRSDGEPSSQDG